MSRWLIIGSVASAHWWEDSRKPADIDILTPAKIAGADSQVCIVESQWHEAAQLIIDANVAHTFADPDTLYTLKVSHAEWNIKWEKTMFDIDFMQDRGCKLRMELYKELIKVWKQVHGAKRVNMARSMDAFFCDAVERKHDHEMLHELVAFKDRPMHERLRPNQSTAWCDEDLFNALDPQDQLLTALEEILAVSIERGRLTTGSKLSERLRAVHQAYFKLVTSMTTGWFARYLITHRRDLLHSMRPTWQPKLEQSLLKLTS